ncbi:MAG: SRPBCC family protein [Acidobacteriota bacterium]
MSQEAVRGRLFLDPEIQESLRERVLAPSWQLVDVEEPERGELVPFALLPGSLDEPLLLTRDDAGELRCLQGTCTHRGFVLAEAPARGPKLRCRYHGRRFDLSGRCLGSPGFDDVADFPGEEDHLQRLPWESLGPLRFTTVQASGAPDFDDWLGLVPELMGFLDWSRFERALDREVDHEIDAHWTLYLENFLESLHVPFVHPSLTATVDPTAYEIETWPQGSVQVGFAAEGESAFELPAGHRFEGRRVAAFHFQLFPNTLLNFYPWGLSANLVDPLGDARCRVRYRTWVGDPSKLDQGAGGDLPTVEREDQQVVRSVQRGARSRLFRPGRLVPRDEAAVVHFQAFAAAALKS